MVASAQTPSKTLIIGPRTNDNKVLKFNRSTNAAQIRWNESVNKLQFANDGATFSDFATGSVPNGNVNTYTTTQVLTVANDLVLLDATSGAFTVTLPTAIGNSGKTIKLRRTDSTLANVITIACTGGQTVGGTSTKPMHTIGEMYEVVSNGTNWLITGRETNTLEADAGALEITSANGYAFTLSATASITVGTIYTSGGFTYYVSATTSSSATLNAYGTGIPAASGTLTFVSGSPSGNLTFNSRALSLPVKGAADYDRFVWHRSGQYVNFRYEARWAAGTQGAGDYGILLPVGLKIDMTNLHSGLQAGLVLNSSFLFSSIGYGNNLGSVVTGPFVLFAGNTDMMKGYLQGTQVFGGSASSALNAIQSMSILGRYRVVGWEP